jgi:hypothetical protein
MLVDALRKQGLSVWWDPNIMPGDSWRGTIGRALKDAKCVIVLWSEKSVESRWVQEEAENANKRRILFPVLIDDVSPPIGFGGIQSANLVGWAGGAHNEEIRNLSQAIHAKLSEVGGAAAEQAASHASGGAAIAVPTAETSPPPTLTSQGETVSRVGNEPPPVLAPEAGPSRVPKGNRKWYVIALVASGAVVVALVLNLSKKQVMRNPTDQLNYRRIPAGIFLMGCNFDCKADQLPRHAVTISSDYWITENEVTAAAYQRFAQATVLTCRRNSPRSAETLPNSTRNGGRAIIRSSTFRGRRPGDTASGQETGGATFRPRLSGSTPLGVGRRIMHIPGAVNLPTMTPIMGSPYLWIMIRTRSKNSVPENQSLVNATNGVTLRRWAVSQRTAMGFLI